VQLAYDPGGRLVQKALPNGVTATYTYFADGRLEQLVNRAAGGGLVSQHDYTYDGVGNRDSHVELIAGVTMPYKYVYDALSQLLEVRHKDTNALIESYAYDQWGNRTRRTGDGLTRLYKYDLANQLTEIHQTTVTGPLLGGLVYDANGSSIKKCEGGTVTVSSSGCTGDSVLTLTYDGGNKLVQAAKTGLPPETYAYDPEDRRVRKTVGSITTDYLYSGPDIIAEHTTWAGPAAVYTHGPGMDDPLLRIAGTTAEYYHADGLGSVVGLSSGSGAVDATARYDAWGTTVGTTGTLPLYGYTGREPNATGLLYYRSRYHDPGLGRFMQRDPNGLAGGDINLYAYVANNPINATDPEGEFAQLLVGGAANVVIGYGIAKLTGQEYSWKRASVDFVVGAATSGIAVVLAARRGAQIVEGIYTGSTSAGKYVGQSGNIARRLEQHVASGKIAESAASRAGKFEVLGGKVSREVAEQRMIDRLGGVEGLANKVNPIGGRPHLAADTTLGIMSKTNRIGWPRVIATDSGYQLMTLPDTAHGEHPGDSRRPSSSSSTEGIISITTSAPAYSGAAPTDNVARGPKK
jgi:RHS repeat-associated protein